MAEAALPVPDETRAGSPTHRRDEFQREVEQPFKLARARNVEEQRKSWIALRSHALYCASMVYNGWFGDRTAKYPEAERITDLADRFVDWLNEGGEAGSVATTNDLRESTKEGETP